MPIRAFTLLARLTAHYSHAGKPVPVRVSGPLPSSSGHKDFFHQRVVVIIAGGVGVSCMRVQCLSLCCTRFICQLFLKGHMALIVNHLTVLTA